MQRPFKLVFEAQGSVGTVSLEAVGDQTRLQVTIQCTSREQLEHLVKLGVHTNTGKTLDNLVHHVRSSRVLRSAK